MNLPWSELPYFLAVSKEGNLSKAAKVLNTDRTTVGRRLERLEKKLHQPLFERHNGQLVLTSFGRRVFIAAEAAEQGLAFLNDNVGDVEPKRKRVRLSLSEHLLLTLSETLTAFSVQHTDILLELLATDRLLDLRHFEADIVLRISNREPEGLQSTNIGKPLFSLYRSVNYVNTQNSYIARPGGGAIPKSVRSYLSTAQHSLIVDGLVSTREFIAQGAGVGILPNYFGSTDRRIECCSDPLPPAGYSLYIAYLPEQAHRHQVRTLVRFLENFFKENDGFEHKR